MNRLIFIVAAGAILAGANAAELQRFTDCRVLEAASNDGDSFRVQCGDRQLVVRLYFVDCPETTATSDVDAKRVRDQSRYFGITDPARVVECGQQAHAYTLRVLSDPFTIHTAFASALGRSTEPRVYAFATTSTGDDLGSVLVEQGLARNVGVRRATPDGRSALEMYESLHDLQDTAMLNRAGIWAASDPRDLVRLRAEQRAEDRDLAEFRDQLRRPPSLDRPLDLNAATKRELQSVSGIGPILAAKIIAGRPYRTVDDLVRVDGVGTKLFERIRPYFVVRKSTAEPAGAADTAPAVDQPE